MAVRVGRLRPPLRERDELVAHVHEGHAAGAAAELELEDAPVELERLLDVADLEGDVVQADEPGAGHATSPGRPSGAGRPGCQCGWGAYASCGEDVSAAAAAPCRAAASESG